jgi:hypothetical protein
VKEERQALRLALFFIGENWDRVYNRQASTLPQINSGEKDE